MKIRKYWVLTPTIYRFVMCLLMPALYLGIMFSIRQNPAKTVYEIMLYPCIFLVDLWMDQYLFHGVTNRKQMEFVKTAYHGLEIFRDALCIDKVRRFSEIFLLTAISQYTGFVRTSNITIPLVFFYLSEALLQYLLAETVLLVSRQVSGPMIFLFIAIVTYGLDIVIQIPLIFINELNGNFLFLIMIIILALILSIASQRYMMRTIYEGRYDERVK